MRPHERGKTEVNLHFAWYTDHLIGQALDVVRRTPARKGEAAPNLRRLAAILGAVACRETTA